jgi:hypothetical protein
MGWSVEHYQQVNAQTTKGCRIEGDVAAMAMGNHLLEIVHFPSPGPSGQIICCRRSVSARQSVGPSVEVGLLVEIVANGQQGSISRFKLAWFLLEVPKE